jgi:hypothetical protein
MPLMWELKSSCQWRFKSWSFWAVTLCSVFLWNAGILSHHYTASYPRGLQLEFCSWVWMQVNFWTGTRNQRNVVHWMKQWIFFSQWCISCVFAYCQISQNSPFYSRNKYSKYILHWHRSVLLQVYHGSSFTSNTACHFLVSFNHVFHCLAILLQAVIEDVCNIITFFFSSIVYTFCLLSVEYLFSLHRMFHNNLTLQSEIRQWEVLYL